MINPKKLMELNRLKDEFADRHPKAWNFVMKIGQEGIEEGSVIELTITKPDGSKTGANMRVYKEDLELLNILNTLNTSK